MMCGRIWKKRRSVRRLVAADGTRIKLQDLETGGKDVSLPNQALSTVLVMMSSNQVVLFH
jgi:hypothetical protein